MLHVIVVKFIHYCFTEVQYSLIEIYWFVHHSLDLAISQPIRFLPKRTPDLKLDFITILRYDSLLVTSFMFLCFFIFSIVFPKTVLFINLKKSFSKSFVASVLSCVLKSM